MIIPSTSPHEIARWASELTTHTFYVFLMAQPMAFAFGKWLEHTHFKPGTRRHFLLTCGAVEWSRNMWLVLDAHYIFDGIIERNAARFGIEITPGGPKGFPGSEIGPRMRTMRYARACPCEDFRDREYKAIQRLVCRGIKLSPERIAEYVCHAR